MGVENKRRNTRSRVWSDTQATIRVADGFSLGSNGNITFKGTVANLGSNGMFLQTNESVPVPARAEIEIDFDPESSKPGITITASGETVHSTSEGVGIKFTVIDVAKLQQCIIAKMNRLEAG